MLTPDYLLRISEGAEDISEGLHADIINRIIERMMLRIGRGEEYLLTAQDKKQIKVLQDSGDLLEDILKEIAKKTKLQQEEIKEAFEDAGIKCISYDDKIYEQAGLSPISLWASPNMVRIMQRNYEATLGEWYNFTRTTADESQKAFINAMDKAYNLTSSGAVSYTQAVKEAINDIIEDGADVYYTNPDTGKVHKDTIETATLRAVRTGISQMSGQITLERMKEMNWDIVLTSAHLGARIGDGGENHTNHTWWQGKFFSLSGKDKRFLPFSVCGLGDVQGINGANCRHSFGPGDGKNNPFDNIDNEENRRIRELEERQRLLERRIRKTKREVMGWKTAVDNCTDEKLKFELDMKYQRKSALLQNQNKAYNDFCEKNGLKRRDDRVQIARWDRKQAAAATGAAKRYLYAKEKVPEMRTILGGELKTYTRLEIEEIAKRTSNIADYHVKTESLWSGKIVVDDNWGKYGKLWNCDISVRTETSPHIILHEQLHARSISHYTPEIYAQFQNIEEATVQYMAQEISKVEGIKIIPSAYDDMVDSLRNINSILGICENDYQFAKKLIETPVIDRLDMIEEKSFEIMMSGGTIETYQKLRDLIDMIS